MLKKGKIHFFTGKGGVGKSTLSIAFARELAAQGHNTLWLEFTQNPSVNTFEGVDLGFLPQKIGHNLSVASWNGEDCLQEFVKHSVKLRIIYEAFYKSKAITALIKAAPALREISFLGYLTSHLRDFKPSLHYDQVVVDAPSTGHFLACLKIPRALLDISSLGPMGTQCQGIINVLKDPSKTSFYTVFLAEPLVYLEYKYLESEMTELGFQCRPWLNKAMNPKVIQELKEMMNGISSESSNFEKTKILSEEIIEIQTQQEAIIHQINTNNILISYEENKQALERRVSKTVQGLLRDNIL